MLTSWTPHSLLFPCKEGAGRSTYLCPCPLYNCYIRMKLIVMIPFFEHIDHTIWRTDRSIQRPITGLKRLSLQNSIGPIRIFLHVNGAKKSVEKKAKPLLVLAIDPLPKCKTEWFYRWALNYITLLVKGYKRLRKVSKREQNVTKK